MNCDKNRGPNSLLLASIPLNFTMALKARISTPQQPYLYPDFQVQPELLHDHGPRPLLPSKIPTSHTGDCRGLKVQAGSAAGGRQGNKPQEPPLATAGGAGSGKTQRRKDAEGGDQAGGYLPASNDTAPLVAMATRHLRVIDALSAVLRALA